MNKKFARYGLLFYIITMVISFLFPKQLFGNIYFVGIYLGVCLTLLYFIYFWKRKKINHVPK
jgi:hypothetical protein